MTKRLKPPQASENHVQYLTILSVCAGRHETTSECRYADASDN
jgi:hypothetical protein